MCGDIIPFCSFFIDMEKPHEIPPTAALDDVLEGSSPAQTLNKAMNDPPPANHAARASSPAGDDGTAAHKLVTFAPGDPGNPKNWSKAFKWYCTMVVAMTCFVVALASSVVTADIPGVEKSFDVSEEAALVSVSVFVVGFGVGPMLFAPLSEIYGRRII